ncbi:MAG: radical SAM protein, partial [Oscillospiraceae bacterium]|nr:radical SAM protein [Oscillospiraceae bacterium]
MKILYILPGIGKKSGERYLKSWLMEPLTIAVLNKLTPQKYKRAFLDDRIETIDKNTPCDVVAITVETYTAKRAYELAGRFRRQGKIIVMGGYH